MGLNLDYVFGKQCLEDLEKLLGKLDGDGQEKLVDEYLAFHKHILQKYPNVIKSTIDHP